MKHWQFYDQATGEFALAACTIPDAADPAGFAPPGCTPIEGVFDPRTQRVNVTTGNAESYVRAPDPVAIASALRARRDALLSASDWTQLADAPILPAAAALWKAARVLLRNLPQQPGFPLTTNWPTLPDGTDTTPGVAPPPPVVSPPEPAPPVQAPPPKSLPPP